MILFLIFLEKTSILVHRIVRCPSLQIQNQILERFMFVIVETFLFLKKATIMNMIEMFLSVLLFANGFLFTTTGRDFKMSLYYPYIVIGCLVAIFIMFKWSMGNPEKEERIRSARNAAARSQTHIDYAFNLKPVFGDVYGKGDMRADSPEYFLYHVRYADGTEGVTDNPNKYPQVSTMGVGHKMQVYTAPSNLTGLMVDTYYDTQKNRRIHQGIAEEELTMNAIRDMWDWSAKHPETWARNNPQDNWD